MWTTTPGSSSNPWILDYTYSSHTITAPFWITRESEEDHVSLDYILFLIHFLPRPHFEPGNVKTGFSIGFLFLYFDKNPMAIAK